MWLILPLAPCILLATLWPFLVSSGVVPPNSDAWYLIPLAPFFGWVAPLGLMPMFNDLVGIDWLAKLGVALLSLGNLWLLIELGFLKGKPAPDGYGVDPLSVRVKPA